MRRLLLIGLALLADPALAQLVYGGEATTGPIARRGLVVPWAPESGSSSVDYFAYSGTSTPTFLNSVTECRCQNFTTSEAGSVQAVRWYNFNAVANAARAGNIGTAIFDDTGAHNLLGQSASYDQAWRQANLTADGWVVMPLTSPVAIAAGSYWTCLWFNIPAGMDTPGNATWTPGYPLTNGPLSFPAGSTPRFVGISADGPVWTTSTWVAGATTWIDVVLRVP